jgi:hypothetical protein
MPEMTNNDIVFAVFYGAISISGLSIAIHYWYHEIKKKHK